MADRRRQVIQLLASRYDQLPGPKPNLVTPSGFAPGNVEPCPSCAGRGLVPDRFNRPIRCTRCNGRGRLAYDPMDAQHAPIGSTATSSTARPRHRKMCDRCGGDGVWKGERCELCHGEGRRDVHAFELHLETEADPVDVLDRWEAALKRRRESGSYVELDQALAGIAHHINKPARYQPLTRHAARVLRLLDEIWLPPATLDYETLDEWSQELVDRALEYIVWRMPTPIRVPTDVVDNAREHREHRKRVKGRAAVNGAAVRRDDEIRKLIRRGTPTQRVAFDYGLSVSQVNRIVARQNDAT